MKVVNTFDFLLNVFISILQNTFFICLRHIAFEMSAYLLMQKLDS